MVDDPHDCAVDGRLKELVLRGREVCALHQWLDSAANPRDADVSLVEGKILLGCVLMEGMT